MSGTSESAQVDQARAAVAEGSAWRARDVLERHLEGHRDPDALMLLGEVYHGMGDLPAAGAMWFAAGAKGPEVDEAVAAWRERNHDDFPSMWRSLPASVRADPQSARLEALRERARALDASIEESDRPQGDSSGSHGAHDDGDGGDGDGEGGLDAAQFIAWLAAAAFVACGVIGLVTVLRWLVPG
ncbi:MAG: hypothetical protein WBL35_11025 [Ornithinibacter sp.]